MKQNLIRIAGLLAAIPFTMVASAQDVKKDKEAKEKSDTRQLIVTLTGEKDDKTVIEVVGEKVTVNGKPIEDYKDKNGDITVRLNKYKSFDMVTDFPGFRGNFSFNDSNYSRELVRYGLANSKRAMLGVTTEKAENGARINSITKGGAAEKIGLKEGDIITKVGDTRIEDAGDLTEAIRKKNPGDKVDITYLHEGKEKKATAELTAWKGQTFQLNSDDMKWKTPDANMYKFNEDFKVFSPHVDVRGVASRTPKLGLSVEDTDEGKGVKVITVDQESNAEKAGLKLNDIITEVDGKAVNSTDEMVKLIKENKEKVSVMMKLKRDGKNQNVEVRMPRQIKTANM